MKKQSVINASDVKPNFSTVKEVWQEMLSEYYEDNNMLKEEFIVDVNCPHCDSNDSHSSFDLNGFNHKTYDDGISDLKVIKDNWIRTKFKQNENNSSSTYI